MPEPSDETQTGIQHDGGRVVQHDLDLSSCAMPRRRFMRRAIAASAIAALPMFVASNKQTKRIGFVDYQLDNYHARVYLAAIRETLKDRGFTVSGGTALEAEESRAWAKNNDLPYFDSIEQLNDAVDYFIVLAPANPEVHLELCQRVFPFSKTTYVDKTFAPNHATAKKIFALADRYKVAVQTTSALRYTDVQRHVAKVGRDRVRHMVAWGGGSNFSEYVIHPVELVVSCMGHEAVSLMRRGSEPESQLLINFTRGRTAVVNVYNKTRTSFAASVTTDQATEHFVVDNSRLFVDTTAAMLDFFASGRSDIDRRESLTVMRIIDAANSAAALEGFTKL